MWGNRQNKIREPHQNWILISKMRSLTTCQPDVEIMGPPPINLQGFRPAAGEKIWKLQGLIIGIWRRRRRNILKLQGLIIGIFEDFGTKIQGLILKNTCFYRDFYAFVRQLQGLQWVFMYFQGKLQGLIIGTEQRRRRKILKLQGLIIGILARRRRKLQGLQGLQVMLASSDRGGSLLFSKFRQAS